METAVLVARAAEGDSQDVTMSSIRIFGDITSELYGAWYGRVGSTNYILADQVQHLFNDIDLFPSKSQIYEMLHCACECSNRNSAAYLTFGEFCIFAAELKRCYEFRDPPKPVQLSRLKERNGIEYNKRSDRKSASSSKYEVFLGGSCNPTSWRQDVAIPMLKNLGITYYNPQVSHWGPELLERENQAKQNASVLFFVVNNQTRSVASIIEAAHIAGWRQKLILVLNGYDGPGQKIWGEKISQEEYEDLTTGQLVLQDLVERQGIPVFDNIAVALNCTAKIIRDNKHVEELGLKDNAQPVKMAHVPLGDKLLKLREAFDALDTANTGEICLPDVCMAFRVLTNKDLTLDDLRNIVAGHTGKPVTSSTSQGKRQSMTPLENVHLDFEEFCGAVAEFTHDPSYVVGTNRTHSKRASGPSSSDEEWAILPTRSLRLTNSTAAHQLVGKVTDVYLGGSCGCTWREDIAIPILKKNGLTFYNPQISQWSKRLIPLEATAMDNSKVLLFVITDKSRSVAEMAMAGHYIGLGCNVVLCVQHVKEDSIGSSEKLSKQALKDYNRGRTYLSDLANREGVPVFEDIVESVECVVQKSKSASLNGNDSRRRR